MLFKLNPYQNPIPIDIPIGVSASPRMTVVSVAGPATAQYGTVVSADPSGGDITVTLPAASAVTATGSNIIMVKNNSDSVHVVNVARAGGDTIDGVAGPYVLAARESAIFVSDGVSEFLVF